MQRGPFATRRQGSRAPFTWFTAGTCLALLAAGVFLSRSPRAILGLPTAVLYGIGMCDGLAVFAERRFETLLTATFVHASLLHLVFNLYALVVLGPPIERTLGSRRTAAVFFASGVAGALASAAVGYLGRAERTSEGASGAVCGLLAAALVVGLRSGGQESALARSMARWLGLLVAVEAGALLLGVPTHFDNAAHLTGAAVGAAMGASFRPEALARARVSTPWGAIATVAACFALFTYRQSQGPFNALGASDRYDLAALLIRSGRCDEARAALDAGKRLVPDTPTALALESEWRSACARAASEEAGR